MLIAGPTTVLSQKREKSITPLRFDEEVLDLKCEWESCDMRTSDLELFMGHVTQHIPVIEMSYENAPSSNPNQFETKCALYLVCGWASCPHKALYSEDLHRHLYLHAYHTKLKCIGTNTLIRNNLAPCRADISNRNILPDLSDNVVCAWGDCSEKFLNIQAYYHHIRDHCLNNPKGKTVAGGINCLWSGCASVFPNITKLRDHMRSHTQEKLLACPTCGGLFSNRTRFFDHCKRQIAQDEGQQHRFVCSVCMKTFTTLRLLRDHIRSHVNTYRCSLCDMSCSSPSALQNHIKYRHMDEKPYPCEESGCNYSAKTVSDLQKHTKTHQAIKYKCEEPGCVYTAKSIASLNFHWTRVHSEDKAKYVCHVCEKKFLRGYYLTKHLIGIHKLQWPSGHSRFRYKLCTDGLFRLQTLRYETVEEGEEDEEMEEKDPLRTEA